MEINSGHERPFARLGQAEAGCTDDQLQPLPHGHHRVFIQPLCEASNTILPFACHCHCTRHRREGSGGLVCRSH